MNGLKNVYELIDISSSEDEEEILKRASTPIPRKSVPNYRIILQMSHSSNEATADEEECFDISTDSLESSCKKLKLSSSLESIESESHAPQQDSIRIRKEELPDSPESPDESMSSDVFVVEESTESAQSITSSRVAEYIEKIHQEDSGSYFSTPPGTPKKINFRPISPLNDLEDPSFTRSTAVHYPGPLTTNFMMRQPGRAVFPRGVALSQPAPGLACGCRQMKIGRGHGCNLRFPRW